MRSTGYVQIEEKSRRIEKKMKEDSKWSLQRIIVSDRKVGVAALSHARLFSIRQARSGCYDIL